MGKTLHNVPTVETIAPADVDHVTGRGDPQQRYRVYRLCLCPECDGRGRDASPALPESMRKRCPDCRGEGKVLDLVACCADPQGVGTAICKLAEEGEFEDCPIGILIDGGDWLVKPWLPSPRNVADAARVLAKAKTKGE